MNRPGPRYVLNFAQFRKWLAETYPSRANATEAEIRAAFGADMPDSFPARVWWSEPPMEIGPAFPVLRFMTLKAFMSNPPPPPPPKPAPTGLRPSRLSWLSADFDDDYEKG